MKTDPLTKRIARALAGKGSRNYHEVLREVFPRDLYPNAMRPSSHGGPPGCAMAFGRALRRMNISKSFTEAGRGTLYLSHADAARWLVGGKS